MRKNIFICILALGLLLGFSIESKAIKAYPYPITVTQPDGTTLTIKVHGDEFLNWTTCGSRLVAKGEDGFYYVASFNEDGIIVRSNTRASNGAMVTSSASSVTPPATAIARALEMRAKTMGHNRKGGISQTATGSISIGKKPFLVLLVQFSDLKFTIDSPKEAFTNLLNQEGYSANNGTGSVRDYFVENSKNKFEPDFEIAGPITLSKSYSYYGGGNSSRYIELIIEACKLLDNSDFDFSRYDNDGDGTIDNIFYYFAGHNEAEGGGSETIWPHSWNVSYFQDVFFDGKRLATYACASEYSGASGTRFCGIGTFSHEFGHVIGLPDFYDIDYGTNGSAAGLYDYSLMCSGCYNNNGKTPPYLNPIEKNLLGWLDMPTELSFSGRYTLEGVSSDKAYIFKTTNPGEFYMLENRRNVGWDRELSSWGMVIYHVDQSDNMVHGMTARDRWSSWDINSCADHECFDLVASVYPESNLQYYSQLTFPGYNNVTSFTGSTSPSSKSWLGEESGYDITDIAFDGELVTFNLVNANIDKLFFQLGYNAIESPKTSYSVGDVFTIRLIQSTKVPSSYSFTFDGNAVDELTDITLTAGEHIIKAELVYSDGTTETLIQYIKAL